MLLEPSTTKYTVGMILVAVTVAPAHTPAGSFVIVRIGGAMSTPPPLIPGAVLAVPALF
jgi:hypothetical protein